MARDFDVLISGLGPTGATLAGLLGQRGLRVAVFDRLPDLYPLPRAIGLDHEAMRIIQELGVSGRMSEHIDDYRPSEYLGMDGKLIKRLDTVPKPYPLWWAPNYVFNQPAFEGVLRDRLKELDRVEVYLESEVLECGQDANQAWMLVRVKDEPTPLRFTAEYLVACDGGSSPIRKRLGIDLEDLDFDEPWLVVDALVPEAKLAELPQTQVQYCEAARPATFVVGPRNHRRWEIMLNPEESTDDEFPDERLWPLLARWIKPGEAELLRRAAYRFHGLVARTWRQERIFLAGDAAHMTPPFMAQGMVQGMRDAHNLAWKLDRVVRGRSSSQFLDTYFKERSPHVKQTTLTAMELGRVICERDADKARARDAALRAAQGGKVKTAYRQQMIPGLRAGLIAEGTPGAGEMFPQPIITCGSQTGRIDDLLGHGTLLILNRALPDETYREYRKLAGEVGACIVALASSRMLEGTVRIFEKDALLENWFQKNKASVAIVRPDRYTYGTAASHTDGLQLLQQFKQALV